jgi:hypothetical protein
VKALPVQVGEWQGEFKELSPEEKRIAGVQEGLVGRYVHRTRKKEVQFLLVCGLPRNISLHTPEDCYAGSGYAPVGDPVKEQLKVDGIPVNLQVAAFQRDRGGIAENLRIMWTFSPDGRWEAPDSPRSAFSGRRFLYKIYLVRDLSKSDEPLEKDDVCLELLRQLLPELQKVLFPSSPQA